MLMTVLHGNLAIEQSITLIRLFRSMKDYIAETQSLSSTNEEIGRKTECKVHNVLRVRNGYQLIVSFRGDSGNQFMHSLYISYKDAALLKPDMVLECYVNGDDCYIDESRIVVKEKTGF